jgi:hypothetical protein
MLLLQRVCQVVRVLQRSDKFAWVPVVEQLGPIPARVVPPPGHRRRLAQALHRPPLLAVGSIHPAQPHHVPAVVPCGRADPVRRSPQLPTTTSAVYTSAWADGRGPDADSRGALWYRRRRRRYRYRQPGDGACQWPWTAPKSEGPLTTGEPRRSPRQWWSSQPGGRRCLHGP